MLDKIPPPISDLLAPMWVWIIAILAGGVSYLEDFKWEDSWKVWTLKALTKGSSSALAAVLTYHSLLAANVTNTSAQFVMVGIAGHMGVEALRALGQLWQARIK